MFEPLLGDVLLDGKRRRQEGLGLLDVVVGMALLAVAVMSAAQLVLDTNNMRRTIDIQRLVSDTLDSELKRIEVTPFAEIVATHQDRAFEVASQDRLILQPPQGDPDGLPGMVIVDIPEPPGDASALLNVHVEIEWSDRGGTHRNTRSTLISHVGASP